MEQSDFCQPGADTESANNLLPPSVALAYFDPPQEMHLATAKGRHEVRARYGFHVAELGLLIKKEVGSEVLELPAIAKLPGSPAALLGLINLRGNLVPLYELRVLLGLEARQAGVATMALVFGQGEQAVGVVIEGNPIALSALNQLPNLPPLPDALRDHVSVGYMQDDAVWLEFDHSTFFHGICHGVP